MSNFYYGPQQHHSTHSNLHTTHSHHAGRSRRATRASTAHQHQHHQKQLRAIRLQKEAEESRAIMFRREFDAARSFDYEDDDLFCPFNLMTEDDISSMTSGSDRSSMSSGSPEHSPVAQQAQPAPSFLLSPSNYPTFLPGSTTQSKIHQPLAQRMGAKAIPIVDPSTRNIASPPPSVSPSRQMMQAPHFVMPRRVW